jgi:putative tryptophan/tyrosine transport system substrate-binding protein
MRRREFIGVLGGATVVWPIAARAQRTGKLPRIGYLSDEPPDPNVFHSRDYILARLHQLGYDDGRNIIVDYRYADGKAELLPSLATDLVAIPVDLIVAIGTPASRAALAATRTIPIVMARIGDPVGYGLVSSVARPGGNATAVSVFTQELAQKRLEVLKEAVPGLSRIAALYEQNFPPSENELKQFMTAAPGLNVQVYPVAVSDPTYLKESSSGVVSEITSKSPQALFVASSLLFELIYPSQIVNLAFKSGLPALYIRREYVEIGGLMSYGVPYVEMCRAAAYDIAKILEGEKAGELPVQLPVKIELVVNLKAAKALGVTIPPLLLARADEVIE